MLIVLVISTLNLPVNVRNDYLGIELPLSTNGLPTQLDNQDANFKFGQKENEKCRV